MSVSRLAALFPYTRDPAVWAARHAAGEVPGKVFYNLDELEQHGYDVTPLAGDGRVRARALSKLGGGFDWAPPRGLPGAADLVLSWSESTGVPVAARRGRRSAPTATGVIWMTEPDVRVPRHARWAVIRGLQRCGAVWALSREQLPVLRDQFGVAERALHFLPFGIDTKFWDGRAGEVDPDLVLTVGNDRHRDFATVMSAVDLARRHRPRLRLEAVTAQPLALNAPTDRRYPALSHRTIRELYRRAAVVVVGLTPNLHVSGMTVALEAAAMGRPVVMTGTAGADDYVREGVTGLLTPPGDADAMAAAITSLIDDPAAGAELGGAGRTFAISEHSAATQAESLAAILRTLET